MERVSSEANPYDAPSSERHSAALSQAERYLLTEVLEKREPGDEWSILSRNMGRSLLCSPIALVFAGSFAAVAYAFIDLPTIYLTAATIAAFLAAMAGFFLRDASEAQNSRMMRGLLCSVTDFAEAERLLYGIPKAIAMRAGRDEPLAAIPVDGE